MMGGHLTLKILLEQGVPQGDIISPFIFIIALEILIIKTSKSKNLKGITMETSDKIRAQIFADDPTLTIAREDFFRGIVLNT